MFCTKGNRLYYPVQDIYIPRTDDKFRNGSYVGHYRDNEKSPVQLLLVDMIKAFPVADSLHLIDLGIMKTFLMGWRFGKFNKLQGKWRANEILEISEILKSIKTPIEIHLSVRGLDDLCHWKSTEFRTFFFY